MIVKPTLLLDEAKCRKNIALMFAKAKRHDIELRPHFKTHQSLKIGSWFKEAGVRMITVSSVSMADYFSAEFDDITIAFPTNVLEIDKINELARLIKLNLCIENEEALVYLSEKLSHEVQIFLKMDVGYHRTGIDPVDRSLIDQLLHIMEHSPLLTFIGFLGHAGHSYNCVGEKAVNNVHQHALQVMDELKSSYSERYPDLCISLGDTPSCSITEDFTGVDEIRPGNFVFYDLTQHKIGSNDIDQIAVVLACPIVAKHKDRSEIVVYGGGVHLSKDRLHDKVGVIYGRPVERTESGWRGAIAGAFVSSISQEHGIVTIPTGLMEQYNIGDLLYILPVHSCMTADLMKEYLTLKGERITMMNTKNA